MRFLFLPTDGLHSSEAPDREETTAALRSGRHERFPCIAGSPENRIGPAPIGSRQMIGQKRNSGLPICGDRFAMPDRFRHPDKRNR